MRVLPFPGLKAARQCSNPDTAAMEMTIPRSSRDPHPLY